MVTTVVRHLIITHSTSKMCFCFGGSSFGMPSSPSWIRAFLVAFVGGVAAISAVFLYARWEPPITVRFRLTAESTEDPHAPKVSGTYLATIRNNPTPRGGMIVDVQGDALFLRLSDGRAIVVLAGHGISASNDSTFAVMPYIAIWGPRFNHYDSIVRRKEKLRGSAEVNLSLLPTMLSFDATLAPVTAVKVWPLVDIPYQLPPSDFIPPIRLRIDVLNGNESVSRGINVDLPWVDDPLKVNIAVAAAGLRQSSRRYIFRR